METASLQNIEEYITTTIAGLSEKARRLFLGRTAESMGYGGISRVAEMAGVSRNTVAKGVAEVKSGEIFHCGDRDRRSGGGRKTAEETHKAKATVQAGCHKSPEIIKDLHKLIESIVSPETFGDPMSEKKWQNKTLQVIRDRILEESGVSHSLTTIRKMLGKLEYSRQKNQKYNQVGDDHPQRDEQFRNIEETVQDYIGKGLPVISIDTKAKEKLGDFIRPGREWRMTGCPRRVLDHDFAFPFCTIYPDGSELIPEELMNAKAIIIPYGVYCLNNNTAHVTVGISSDTSEFAADSIEEWWKQTGKKTFPYADRILILADGGGSNRARGCLFKIALQQLADKIGIEIEVCHYPPGCSKYNPVEHKLWPHVSHAWTAQPLKDLESVLGYISNTKTQTGLSVTCTINSGIYLTEQKKTKALAEGLIPNGIIKADLLEIDLCCTSGDFEHTAMQRWNYMVRPHSVERKWHDYSMPLLI
jgi:transposase